MKPEAKTELSPVDALRQIRIILADTSMPPAVRIVVAAIVLRADNHTATAWASYAGIRREFGVSLDTIATALRADGNVRGQGRAIGKYVEVVGRGAGGATQFRVLRSAEHSNRRSTPRNGAVGLRRPEQGPSEERSQTNPVPDPNTSPAREPKCPTGEIANYWNGRPHRPRVRKLSKERERKLRARWREVDFRRSWRDAIDRIEGSSFCNGANDRGWVATFDWFIANDTNWLKAMEGKYDDRRQHRPHGAESLGREAEHPDHKYRHLA